MSVFVIAALIISGILVGFINTLAGGGTVISITLFMFLGMPAASANATNRIPVIIQTLTSVCTFRKKKLLDIKTGLKLGIPTMLGSLSGALIAVKVNEETFRNAFAVVLIIMAFFMIYNPSQWLYGRAQKIANTWIYLLLFLIGIYGGFIHVGVGYFILIVLLLGSGYDLMKANAMKLFIVFLYTPLTLLIFSMGTVIYWKYGLIHAIGNTIGAFLAAKLALQKGINFVRWVMVAVIIFMILHTFQLIDIKQILQYIAAIQ